MFHELVAVAVPYHYSPLSLSQSDSNQPLYSVMMGAVSVVLARYRWTLYPCLAFLTFIAYQLLSTYLQSGSREDMWLLSSPVMIGVGLLCMRRAATLSIEKDGTFTWSYLYWVGETLVLYMFLHNSMTTASWASTPAARTTIRMALVVISMLATLWFRGSAWNYAWVIGLEIFVLIFVTLALPVMEMILEAILNEKLKKVGDKVRHHHSIMESYYKQKLKQ